MISEGSCDTGDWSNDAEIQIFLLKIQKNFFLMKIQN